MDHKESQRGCRIAAERSAERERVESSSPSQSCDGSNRNQYDQPDPGDPVKPDEPFMVAGPPHFLAYHCGNEAVGGGNSGEAIAPASGSASLSK
jgi:hypothetical protein